MSNIRTVLSLVTVCFALSPLACMSTSADDDAVQGESQALTECDQNGTWAIKVSTPVSWPASSVLQAGTGNVTNWLLGKRVQTGNEIVDTAKVCGAETPDYQATSAFGSEKYGIRFAEATFAALPTFSITGTVSSKEVGATYSAPAAAALIGATMANPTTDEWPANGATLTQVDIDNDTKPGISADTATGDGHSNPPVNLFRTVRANRIYTAFRQVLASSTGTVKTCSRVEGKGTIAVINNKPAIDAHVLGCRRENGTDCSPSEFKLLDGAQPVYTPTGDAVVTMVKLPNADATCADVRALNFAE